MYVGLMVGWMGTFLSRFWMVNFKKASSITVNLLRISYISKTMTPNTCEKWPRIVVTLHATLYWNSDPCSLSTHVHFQDPDFISITFLFSILTSNLDSGFGTLYTRPCLTLPIPCPFPSTMTEASVILSQTYSSPCCTHDPA